MRLSASTAVVDLPASAVRELEADYDLLGYVFRGPRTRIYTDQQRNKLCGVWCAALTQHVLGGVRCVEHDRRGDIEHEVYNAMIEVKACGNGNSPKIYTHQLELHRTDRGFPYAHSIYALVHYRSHERGLHDRSSANVYPFARTTPTAELLNAYLARNVLAVYVLDADVLQALEKRLGTRSQRRDGQTVNVIALGWRDLQDFEEFPEKSVRWLRLNERSFETKTISVETRFRGYPISFPLTSVLPRRIIRAARRRLERPNRHALFARGKVGCITL